MAGAALTLPLYKFDFGKFRRSSVFIKIVFWIPIFLVFLGVLYASSPLRLAIFVLLLILSLGEVIRATSPRLGIFLLYWILFAAGLSHLVFLGASYSGRFVNILITLCLGTVLADVAAYFAGNYGGRHSLPKWLNPRKSYEGAAGEIVGALLGVLITDLFIESVASLWIFLPIGIGAVVGDLTNSYFKRRAKVGDWSRLIPGHGGITDRLSSLAGSALLTYCFLKITSLG